MRCFHCNKGVLLGRSHTHHRGVAGGRWKKRAQKTVRLFKPNLHAVKVVESGIVFTIKLCSKCLKRIEYDKAHNIEPFYNLLKDQSK